MDPAADRIAQESSGRVRSGRVVVLVAGSLLAGALGAASPPRAISPGATDRAPEAAGRCPTFSWGTLDGVNAWRLSVYRTGPPDRHASPELVLEQRVHGSAAAWTPSLERCLPGGGWYAWEVTALRFGQEPVASDPMFFRTLPGPTTEDVERAFEVIEAWRRSRSSSPQPPAERAIGEAARVAEREPREEGASPTRSTRAGAATGSAAVSGSRDDPAEVGFGVRGTSASPQAGSAGISGVSTAAGGDVAGVRASHQSADGTAVLLEAPSGGALVRGVGPGGEVFSVDASGALAATTFSGAGSGLTGVDADTLDGIDSAFLLGHDHYGQSWSGGVVSQGLRIETSGTFVASFEGRTNAFGFGVAGVATSSEGGVGSVGLADSEAAVGGLFSNLAGGTALAVGLSEVTFSVSEAGDVVATSYQGDGSQLAGILGPGQGCPFGEALLGIEQDGSPSCGSLPRETFTSLLAVGDFVRGPAVAIGEDGLAVISFFDSSLGALKVAHCERFECTSANVETVDSPGGSNRLGEQSAIAIGSDGLPVVVYTDTFSGDSDLKIAHCDDLRCASATVSDLSAVGLFFAEQPAIAIGVDGLPVISYRAGFNAQLGVAHCDDLVCSTANHEIVDPTLGSGHFSSVAIGSDGLPVVSYSDESAFDLKVAHCADALCAGANVEIVEGPDLVGRATSIAIGPDDLPVISYRDSSNEDLKVAHCDDLSCTTTTIVTIDGPGDVGSFTSLAIGSDGLPLVAYSDDGNDDLRIAHCDDPACGSSTVLTLDAGPGAVGGYAATAIGSDGLPLIVYTDFTNRTLEVAHCASVDCS